MKTKTKYLRRWLYSTYFSGDMYVDMPLDATEEEVISLLNEKHYGGNWKKDTLKRGGKIKDRS